MLEDDLDELRIGFLEVGRLELHTNVADASCDLTISLRELLVIEQAVYMNVIPIS